MLVKGATYSSGCRAVCPIDHKHDKEIQKNPHSVGCLCLYFYEKQGHIIETVSPEGTFCETAQVPSGAVACS